mmetsp:Transcript_33025/g.50604  ORF Transcript_33025/g.50604 Transcript_33025/m.50604 type:complete len:205 (+) Transcript_33025:908-1522(+)
MGQPLDSEVTQYDIETRSGVQSIREQSSAFSRSDYFAYSKVFSKKNTLKFWMRRALAVFDEQCEARAAEKGRKFSFVNKYLNLNSTELIEDDEVVLDDYLLGDDLAITKQEFYERVNEQFMTEQMNAFKYSGKRVVRGLGITILVLFSLIQFGIMFVCLVACCEGRDTEHGVLVFVSTIANVFYICMLSWWFAKINQTYKFLDS